MKQLQGYRSGLDTKILLYIGDQRYKYIVALLRRLSVVSISQYSTFVLHKLLNNFACYVVGLLEISWLLRGAHPAERAESHREYITEIIVEECTFTVLILDATHSINEKTASIYIFVRELRCASHFTSIRNRGIWKRLCPIQRLVVSIQYTSQRFILPCKSGINL